MTLSPEAQSCEPQRSQLPALLEDGAGDCDRGEGETVL